MPISETKSVTYDENASNDVSSDSVPILTAGIGTRIAEIARRVGNRGVAAELAEVSPASFQRYVSELSMPPFDTAARLCLRTHTSMEWLATGSGPQNASELGVPADSQVVRTEDLIIAMNLADEALSGRTLRRESYAKLVALIYDAITNGLPEAQILKFAVPASKGLED